MNLTAGGASNQPRVLSKSRREFGLPAQAPITTGKPDAGRKSSRVPFYLASILLFLFFARPFDTFLKGYRIPAVICSICIVATFLTGGTKELRSKVGIAALMMVGWMTFSIPFSYWRGGSFAYVLSFLEFSFPLMLLLAIAPRTVRDVVKLCVVLTLSCLSHLILNASEFGGRYSLTGTFGNPDDVALLAGFTIPFLALPCARLKNPLMRYGFLIGGIGYLILIIGRTATRAAIPALVAMLAVYFFRSDGVQKGLIVISASIGLVIAIFALPTSAVVRLATVIEAFGGPTVAQSYEGLTEAQASSAERHELLQDAMATAVRHPLWGVGAGVFAQYRFDHMLRADGKHKPYLPAHNTYLEIASECGVPGLIFYLIFMGSVYNSLRASRTLSATGKTAEAELVRSSVLCLEAAFVYFAVCATFMTCDKHPQLFALAGLAIALQRIATQSKRPVLTTQATPLRRTHLPQARDRSTPAWAR